MTTTPNPSLLSFLENNLIQNWIFAKFLNWFLAIFDYNEYNQQAKKEKNYFQMFYNV